MATGEEQNIQEKIRADVELRTKTYREYFDILRRNDAPMVNNFPDLAFLTKELPTARIITVMKGNAEVVTYVPVESEEEAMSERRKRIEGIIEGWMVIKTIYDKINPDEQNENTGRIILEQTKDLINRFHQLFMEAATSALYDPAMPPNIPEELFKLRKQIFENAIIYGNLPAVKTYEEVGRIGTLDDTHVKTRDEWFRAGKPTNTEWFKKWFNS